MEKRDFSKWEPLIAAALVKEFEGLRLEAYLCPAGVPTIGYGHTGGRTPGDADQCGTSRSTLDGGFGAGAAAALAEREGIGE